MRSDYSLYIHIPWCVQKCPYCDFNSHAIQEALDESAYLENLLADLESELEYVGDRLLSSIFIGGGTPSTLSVDFYGKLLSAVNSRVRVGNSLEVTMEANPGTVDARNFRGYHEAGINRLSLGFQSLDDNSLRILGRIHSAEQATSSLQIARKAGFDNINIDLMFGLPEQNVEQSLADLEKVIALEPLHISWYQLTLEPNTGFYVNPPENIPDVDTIVRIQEQGKNLLQKNGFEQYEISAWSQQEKQCRHNVNYWLYGDYIGIGAGAHGKIRLADGRFRRNSKKRLPKAFLTGNYISTEHFLDENDRIAEYFMNRLRLYRYFSLQEFEEQTDVDRARIEQAITRALSRKLLIKHDDRYQPSELGYRFLNDLVELFL
jgi:putative oxygen-independent coproporphyrinogen III oxidase